MVKLPYDDNCCAWHQVLRARQHNALIGDKSYPFVVIGAGFAGLAAARRLAFHFPDKPIALVDAQQAGYGAAGRNSGFVIDLPHKTALESGDVVLQKKLINLNRTAITDLKDLIALHHIDCEWTDAGKYQGAVGDEAVVFLAHFAHLLTKLDEPFKWYERDELNTILGTTLYKKAIFTSGTSLMQPALLMDGLVRALPNNVTLYENSPITDLRSEQGNVYLRSNQGRITTGNVLLTTNVFGQEFGFLKNRMVPMMTFASITRPLNDEEVGEYKGTFGWGLTPAYHPATTLRMLNDKRILIRAGFSYVPNYGQQVDDAVRQSFQAQHRASLVSRFPAFKDIPFTHTWGGTYGIARNFKNYFGELKNNVYGCLCDNGVGVAWGTIAGRLIADEIVGSDSQLLRDVKKIAAMPALNPPDPFLGWGIKLRLKAAAKRYPHEH